MVFLALTPRRSAALEALRSAAAEAGGAVHYSLVAARMRISAWTAYDLLVELERLGLAIRRYAQPAGGPGRSRILFEPSQERRPDPPAQLSELTAVYRRFAAIGDEDTAARAFLAAHSTDPTFYLGYWLARLDAAGRQTAEAARTVLESGAAPLAKVQAIAAMGLGAALTRLQRSRLAGRLTAAAALFTARLEENARDGRKDLGGLVDAGRRLEIR